MNSPKNSVTAFAQKPKFLKGASLKKKLIPYFKEEISSRFLAMHT